MSVFDSLSCTNPRNRQDFPLSLAVRQSPDSLLWTTSDPPIKCYLPRPPPRFLPHTPFLNGRRAFSMFYLLTLLSGLFSPISQGNLTFAPFSLLKPRSLCPSCKRAASFSKALFQFLPNEQRSVPPFEFIHELPLCFSPRFLPFPKRYYFVFLFLSLSIRFSSPFQLLPLSPFSPSRRSRE